MATAHRGRRGRGRRPGVSAPVPEGPRAGIDRPAPLAPARRPRWAGVGVPAPGSSSSSRRRGSPWPDRTVESAPGPTLPSARALLTVAVAVPLHGARSLMGPPVTGPSGGTLACLPAASPGVRPRLGSSSDSGWSAGHGAGQSARSAASAGTAGDHGDTSGAEGAGDSAHGPRQAKPRRVGLTGRAPSSRPSAKGKIVGGGTTSGRGLSGARCRPGIGRRIGRRPRIGQRLGLGAQGGPRLARRPRVTEQCHARPGPASTDRGAPAGPSSTWPGRPLGQEPRPRERRPAPDGTRRRRRRRRGRARPAR